MNRPTTSHRGKGKREKIVTLRWGGLPGSVDFIQEVEGFKGSNAFLGLNFKSRRAGNESEFRTFRWAVRDYDGETAPSRNSFQV